MVPPRAGGDSTCKLLNNVQGKTYKDDRIRFTIEVTGLCNEDDQSAQAPGGVSDDEDCRLLRATNSLRMLAVR